jgi:hypothetical protein
MHIRKLVLGAALAAVVLLGLAGSAGAATGTISPGGEISATSVGRFTFTSSSGNIECPVTLNGTLATAASGTLSASPNPSVNPRIGDVTSGSVGACNTGRASVLFPSRPTWDIYNHGVEGEIAELYIEHAQFLISAFILANCLIDARVTFDYDEATSIATVKRVIPHSTTALPLSICPGNPGLVGRFRITPEQTFELVP